MPSTIEGLVALVHPDDAAIFGSAVADHFEGRTTGIDVEFRVRVHGDSEKWLQARGGWFERDADGYPVRVAGTSADITERKRVEEEQARAETRFRTLYESTGDAVMLLDEKGFFDCNQATVRMFRSRDSADFCSKGPADYSPAVQACGTIP